MKFAAVAALTFAALVSAQSRDEIPSCALPCLDDSVKKNTKCDTSDFKCICQNFDAIQGDATGCVLKACGPDVALNKVLPATQKLCEEVKAGGGSSAAPSSAAAPASSAAAPSAPASSADSSPKPTNAVSSAAAPTGGASKTADCTTLAPSVTKPSNGTAPTASAPVTAGAAGFAPVGGLALLAIGALAL